MTADLEKLLAEATPGRRVVETEFSRFDEVLGYSVSAISADENWQTVSDFHNAADAALDAMAPDLARQVIALTAENAALRAKLNALAGEARFAAARLDALSAALPDRVLHGASSGYGDELRDFLAAMEKATP